MWCIVKGWNTEQGAGILVTWVPGRIGEMRVGGMKEGTKGFIDRGVCVCVCVHSSACTHALVSFILMNKHHFILLCYFIFKTLL